MVRVVPITPQGDVGQPGVAFAAPAPVFFVRGAPGEPSLLGFERSVVAGNQVVSTVLEGRLVNDDGEVLGEAFEIGTTAAGPGPMSPRALYAGNGRFLVARATHRDLAIAISIIGSRGEVLDLPPVKANLHGSPAAMALAGDRVTLVVALPEKPADLVVFNLDGVVLDGPRQVTTEVPVALLGPSTAPVLFTTAGSAASLLAAGRAGASARRLLGAPHLYLPSVANTEDASYALVVSTDPGAIVRLR